MEGRQGPCLHCEIEYSSIWRKGPSDKPVLCNACGARWRTKGTLKNYTPRHAQHQEPAHESPHSPSAASSPTIRISFDAVLKNTRRRKRSVRKMAPLPESPTTGFLEELQNSLMHEPEFSSELQRREEEDVLVADANHYAYEDEVGAGCVLLKPPENSA